MPWWVEKKEAQGKPSLIVVNANAQYKRHGNNSTSAGQVYLSWSGIQAYAKVI